MKYRCLTFSDLAVPRDDNIIHIHHTFLRQFSFDFVHIIRTVFVRLMYVATNAMLARALSQHEMRYKGTVKSVM